MIPRRSPYFAPKTIESLFKLYGAPRPLASSGTKPLRSKNPSLIQQLRFMVFAKGHKKPFDYKQVKTLERTLEQSLGLKNVIAINSGRIGLRIILESLELSPKSEIIMPGYTFGLLTKTIKAASLIPKPVDINSKTFQIDPKSVKKAINKRTAAILATHIFGEPCDIKSLLKIAKDNNLVLIEDCAESLGARSDGKMTGTFGDIGIGSFNIAKPLQGITGGIIFGKNQRLISKIKKRLKDSKNVYKTPWTEIARGLFGNALTKTPIWFLMMYIFSFKKIQRIFVDLYRSGERKSKANVFQPKLESVGLSPVLAKITTLNLKNFETRLKTRRRIRNKYIKYLSEFVDFQKINKEDLGSVYMVVGKIQKDPYELRRYLAVRGIDIAIAGEVADDCIRLKNSTTTQIYKSAIALPIYEGLTNEHIKYVADCVVNFMKKD